MTKDEFVKAAVHCVNEYIDHDDRYGQDPQLKVNPSNLWVQLIDGAGRNMALAYAQEAYEESAAAQGDADESATDYQASENPDFYPVRTLLKVNDQGLTVVDVDAIRKIADSYTPVNEIME